MKIQKPTIIGFGIVFFAFCCVVAISVFSSLFAEREMNNKINSIVKHESAYNNWNYLRHNGIIGYSTNANNEAIYIASYNFWNSEYRAIVIPDSPIQSFSVTCFGTSPGSPYLEKVDELLEQKTGKIQYTASSLDYVLWPYIESYKKYLESTETQRKVGNNAK